MHSVVDTVTRILSENRMTTTIEETEQARNQIRAIEEGTESIGVLTRELREGTITMGELKVIFERGGGFYRRELELRTDLMAQTRVRVERDFDRMDELVVNSARLMAELLEAGLEINTIVFRNPIGDIVARIVNNGPGEDRIELLDPETQEKVLLKDLNLSKPDDPKNRFDREGLWPSPELTGFLNRGKINEPGAVADPRS